MPFCKNLDEQAPIFAHDTRFTKGLVRYKDLKTHIKNMETGKYGHTLKDRRTEQVAEECAICLDVLGPACDVTETACKHKYHTFCLVETLGKGSCTSCPLCRSGVRQLVPSGVDGASLKLIAKIRINIDATQWCHKAVFDEIQRKAASLLDEVQTPGMGRYVPFLSSKPKKLRQRITKLIDQLDLLEQFSRINSQGFTKICKKIDKKISSNLAETMQQKYVYDMGYHKDCDPDGNGMSFALREELKRILGLLGSKGERSVGCASIFRSSKGGANTLASVAEIEAVQG
eukprot:CAMPEP_0181303306 /NCGR_PEP_ID=MMETSP1101-20121128/8481_1 /TAXON_ID=46948 /ORGANISM="Rhodomonas abbreviata, Strain Caron Lab Isolate" /LENGTH=286 /DNA_ID=CAMNT_0023408857 /DNA_START=104 /DNA_END=964 /DNA_ORIENTATION=-